MQGIEQIFDGDTAVHAKQTTFVVCRVQTITPERAELLSHIEPCDLLRLDITAVGNKVVKLPLISQQLGHASVRGTIKDYLAPHGPHSLENQFVYDLFLAQPDQMAKRWCGSEANAGRLWNVILPDFG
jgi:hypothetical protein